MAMLIDRVGTYRGVITEKGMGATKNGFPQLVVRVKATERYVDDKAELAELGLEAPAWVDWSGYDAEMVGYLILSYVDKKTGEDTESFLCDGICRATGWDGSAYSTLRQMDVNGTAVTFWVEENEYQGNTRLQIAALDDANAEPRRGLRMMDASEVQALDARFAGLLAARKAKAKTAPAKAPAKAPPKATATPNGAVKVTTPTPNAAVKAGPPKVTAPKGETMEAAWDRAEKALKGKVSEEVMAERWMKAAATVAPGVDDSEITPAQWAKIADTVIKG